MSTRSIIGVVTGYDDNSSPYGHLQFVGQYHHFDGYPTGLGMFLYKALFNQFDSNIYYLVSTLIYDERLVNGWSSILDTNLKGKWIDSSKRNRLSDRLYKRYGKWKEITRPSYYTDGTPWIITQDKDHGGAEYAYIFDIKRKVMHIFKIGNMNDPIFTFGEVTIDCSSYNSDVYISGFEFIEEYLNENPNGYRFDLLSEEKYTYPPMRPIHIYMSGS